MNKLLIVSHNTFSEHANNGKTLSALFGHRSADEVAQLYFQDEVPESSHFSQFYRLRDVDILRGYFARTRSVGEHMLPRARVSDHRENYNTGVRRAIDVLKRFPLFRSCVRELLYHPRLSLLSNADDWVREVRPKSIFLMGSSSPYIFNLAVRWSRFLDIPLFVYFTDDYVLNYQSRGAVSNILNSRLKKAIATAIANAKGCFAIGDDMAATYSRVYGREFKVLCNAIETSRLAEPGIPCANTVFQLVYTGGLTIGRDKMLCDFMRIVSAAGARLGTSIKLSVYSSDHVSSKQRQAFAEAGVCYCGALESSNVYAVQRAAHFLVHVESDRDEYVQQTRLSVSTKIPEYLASGVCVLAFGPGELASMRIFSVNNIGFRIDSSSPLEMQVDAACQIFSDAELSTSLLSNARDYVRSRFSVQGMRAIVDAAFFMN